MKKSAMLFAAAILLNTAHAQYNQKGMIHLSIGGAFGAHATEFSFTQTYVILGYPIQYAGSESDGAATTSLPIQVGGALGNRFTLGLMLEPGSYVPDSADSNQQNKFFHFAIEPKYYLINGERVAWTVSAQLGALGLHIQDDTQGEVLDARLSGPAFSLATGFAYGLGEKVGIGFDLRYMTTTMDVRAIEVNDVSIADTFDGTLRTAGILAQLSVAFRFGGGGGGGAE